MPPEEPEASAPVQNVAELRTTILQLSSAWRITQKELASASGVSKNTVSSFLSGRIMTRYSVAARIWVAAKELHDQRRKAANDFARSRRAS